MANDINQVVMVGRLTRDAELKYTRNGDGILHMGLAVGKKIKKNDQWVDEVSFFDVTQFGKHTEKLAPHLTKGTQLAIVGELRQERWEKDGQKHNTVKIIAESLQLLGGKKDDERGRYEARPAQSGSGNSSGFDDDIPF